jgi:hypothetical protein
VTEFSGVLNFKKLPIKTTSPENQQPLIEKVDQMLSLNKELQEVSEKFHRTLKRKFSLEDLSKKLQDWYNLSFADFIKELGKQKVKLSLTEEAELMAVKNELKLSEDQFNRQKKMYDEGLVSLTQFQQRSASYQNTVAKKTSAENKVAQTRQEIINTQIEQNAAIQEYTEKISKIEGDRYQALGQIEGNSGEIAKLQNQITNYKMRKGLYYIIASQDGQVTQINKAGIGEILKDGESIGMIVPTKVDYAVEFYIKPVDLPLIKEGQSVTCIFDGFPAIVFSGWPTSSYGTFKGKIIAVESNISANGMFKALVIQDKNDKSWPPKIMMGTGVQGIAILNDVPIWYEIWRNINGFPPDYYVVKNGKDEKKK